LSGVVTFTDASGDGDRFRLILSGPGHVAVSDANQDGQAEISLNGTSPSSSLLIGLLRKSASGDGRLPVEQIAVSTGRLSGIYGFTTLDLAGPISPLTGNVQALTLHSIRSGGSISVAGDLKALAVQREI